MNCQEVEKSSISYLDGKLSQRQREAAELHLQVCSSCRERVKGFSKVSGLLQEWEGMEPSAFFDSRLAQRLEQEAASQSWFGNLLGQLWALPPAKPVFAGAMLGVILLAVVLVKYSPAPPETLASQEPQPVAAATASGADELALYQDLPVLEDLDVLRNFEVLQELGSSNP